MPSSSDQVVVELIYTRLNRDRVDREVIMYWSNRSRVDRVLIGNFFSTRPNLPSELDQSPMA